MANPSLQIGNDNWAIKEDNLLGYSTAGTRFVPQPITMTRATLGTRVNPSGLVEDVALLGSEELTDGDFPTPNTAWDLSPTFTIADNKLHCVSDGSYQYANQSAMVVGKTYRITFDITGWVSGNVRVRPSGQSPFQLAGSNGSYIFYYTAVSNSVLTIERNGTPTNLYIENISVKEATIDNLPRVDYTDGTSSLLVEPQRTNLITYSEDFSESGYGWNYTSDALELIELNSIVSPDGTQNADKIAKTATRVYANAHSSQNIVSNQLYSWSMFIKEGTHSIGYLSLTQGDTEYKSYFDLNNETSGMLSGSATTKLEDFGNGWYKCTLSNISSTTDLSVRFDFGMSYSTTNANWPSASDGNGLYMYYWGAQLEASYPTSYIKTSGSTVTRNQETYTKTGISDLINSEEGVLFVEMARQEGDTSAGLITLNDGTNSQTVSLYYFSTGTIYFDILSGSPNVSQGVSGIDTYSFNKIAIKYKSGDIAFWVNGVEVYTSASAISLTGLNTLSFSQGNDAYPFYGKVKQLQVFKTALSDTELATLTT